MLDVVIVGAGPYGLSLAAHLNVAGIDYRIFGKPMQFWKEHLPPDMLLKSLGDSSSLFAPAPGFGIANYYAQMNRPYDENVPVPADVFVGYGQAFKERFVPGVDERNVACVTQDDEGFTVRLEDGECFRSARVVIAVGIRAFPRVPEALNGLPAALLTHSVDYGPVDTLREKAVAVLGSGASAIDLAVSLHERGGNVSIIHRRPKIRFQSSPGPRKFLDGLRSPDSPIGGGWKLFFYANFPQLFRLLPQSLRYRLVQSTLGASPGWFMRDRVLGQIPIIGGQQIERADVVGESVRLVTVAEDGTRRELWTDHIVAATGFQVGMDRLSILDRDLKGKIATANGSPILSSTFESSAKGLYFIGVASAACFGPVMRFVAGAGFAARTVAFALARSTPKRSGQPRLLPAER